ncbi:M56 family metallopeptidase [Allocoleopsis franciscana]|uniref:Zn-dependent protease with chaperone function n=1 Tax=Allocoleopsis franciscana PCC 7113 TaxID=1173027 RepID=K9W856_9CYAN|nr:M56 family metallopeptidase [Allocoleopsis franciscana]AFZ15954.1 Zn-dependent protease with chaperone function [Allocoleopsis franciscana PCC 7113]
MHLIMILTALSLAWLLRCRYSKATGNWIQRWQKTLLLFLLPPLLLLMTALAVLLMGPQGQMIGLHTDGFSYSLVLVSVGLAVGFGVHLAAQGWQSIHKIRTYPQVDLDGQSARLLDHLTLFSAQIGFWQPELVVSQGLLQTLKPEHLQAVLTHEQAHYYYRDTFWFFWLGWLRQITLWLPNTEALWQELLLLRELRADHWARQRVDSLLLAESLLMVVSAPMMVSENFCAAFSRATPHNRLQERIEALLGESESPTPSPSWTWSWVFLSLLPLMAVPFHS